MRFSRLRFPIVAMMAIVALVGIACAALRQPSDHWANFMFTLALTIATAASLGDRVRDQPERRLWFSAAFSTWLYLVLAFGPWFSSEVRPHLLTSSLLEWVHSLTQATPPLTDEQKGKAMLWVQDRPDGFLVFSRDHRNSLDDDALRLQMNYERVGHSLVAMSWGLEGAAFASLILPRGENIGRSARSGGDAGLPERD
jgi:hypothetical protein